MREKVVDQTSPKEVITMLNRSEKHTRTGSKEKLNMKNNKATQNKNHIRTIALERLVA